MKGSVRKLVTRIARGQGGFTLIEMIVVVGIIAVLAAVIVPNIGKFIGSGETGAKNAEWESVQTAMNAMMAEKAVTSVAIIASGSAKTNAWSTYPTGPAPAVPLATYLQDATTVYYYCWDATGKVTSQSEVDAIGTC